MSIKCKQKKYFVLYCYVIFLYIVIMSSKKSGKAKKGHGKKHGHGKKQPSEKIYPVISFEEQLAREIQLQSRIAILKTCSDITDEAVAELYEQFREDRTEKEWDYYIRCDGLPQPHKPWDVGTFFTKLRFKEMGDAENTISWMLDIDERSYLTQNPDIKNKTRKVLKVETRPNIGLQYNISINKALQILENIYIYLEDEELVDELPYRILEEILDRQTYIHQEINELYNRLTYRILCSEDAYMENVTAITAEYFFKGDNFRLHMWTLKNVPIDFSLTVPEGYLEACLHQLGVNVQIPFCVLEENLTIRGIHTNYDHFSEYAKSFEYLLSHTYSHIPTIAEVLLNEWNIERELQEEVRAKIMQRRAEYEEKLAAIEEEQAQKAKNKKKAKKKKIKLPKEPQKLLPGQLPDVSEDFNILESKQHEDFVNDNFHPKLLHIKDQEINLKKYLILGGIYEFYFVTKPKHIDFKTFNITNHFNNSQLNVNKDTEITCEMNFKMLNKNFYSTAPSRSTIVNTTKFSRLSRASYIEYEVKEETAATTGLFVLTFDMPEYLYRWSDPIPCHFEADVIGYFESFMDTPMPTTTNTPIPVSHSGTHLSSSSRLSPTASVISLTSKISSVHSSRSHPESSLTATVTSDLSTTGMIESENLPTFKLTSINYARFLPRRALDTIAVHRSVPIFRQKPPTNENTEKIEPMIVLDDFRLDKQFTKTQIRNIQRLCMPLILASYKFPLEKYDEEYEKSNQQKQKEQRGLIFRTVTYDTHAKRQVPHIFSQHNQRNPERLFPIFDKVRNSNALEEIRDVIMEQEPETLFQLMAVLDNIKQYYKKKYLKTASVRFKTKMKLKKKYRTVVDKQVLDSRRVTVTTDRRRRSSRLSRTSKISLFSKVTMFDDHEDKNLPKLDVPEENIESNHSFESIETGEHEENEYEEEEEEFEFEDEILPEIEIEKTPYLYSHWTTKYIKDVVFKKDEKKVTIYTDRLGIMGFAVNRYEHFPFQYWSIEADPKKENEIVFTLETKHVKCVINISEKGYTGYATDREKKFQVNRPIYLSIDEPILEFRELKKRFREVNLNIFPDQDALFYVKGYFSEKHLACEMHIYNVIALHAMKIQFWFSDWNRLAKRRDIVLYFLHCQDYKENANQVRITPSTATFVDVKEICSDNLDIIELAYELTWKNVDSFVDLHQLIVSQYPNATDDLIHDYNLICNIKNILTEIRPLSYS